MNSTKENKTLFFGNGVGFETLKERQWIKEGLREKTAEEIFYTICVPFFEKEHGGRKAKVINVDCEWGREVCYLFCASFIRQGWEEIIGQKGQKITEIFENSFVVFALEKKDSNIISADNKIKRNNFFNENKRLITNYKILCSSYTQKTQMKV